jgi:hypothetical protein
VFNASLLCRSDGTAAWTSVGRVVKKFVLSHLSLKEVSRLLGEGGEGGGEDPELHKRILGMFGRLDSDSGSGSGCEDNENENENDIEDSVRISPVVTSDSEAENDSSDLGPVDEGRLVSLVQALMRLTGTKKSIYDAAGCNPTYYNLWLSR